MNIGSIGAAMTHARRSRTMRSSRRRGAGGGDTDGAMWQRDVRRAAVGAVS